MSSPEFDWRKDEWPEDRSRLPVQAPLNFNHKLGQRARQMRDALFKLYRELPDRIGVQEATATNFLSPLANALNERSTFYMQLFINEGASPDKSIRIASRKALSIINEIDNELPIRQKLLDAVSHVSEVGNVDKEAKEFAEYLLRKVPHSSSSFGSWLKRIIMRTRLHLHLEPKSSPLSEVRRRLEEVNIACQDCINACDVEELNAPAWPRRGNRYHANSKRCNGNIARMHKMIALRKEEARIFGFHSLAGFKAKSRMGKCAVCIKQLVIDLWKLALESTPTRLDQLLRLKNRTFSWTTWKENGIALDYEAEADILRDCDYTFCANLSPEKDGGILVDWKKLSEYFEVHNTLDVTIRILSNLFGLEFRKVYARDSDPFSKGLVKVWQQDVKVYAVWNDPRNGKDFLGYLYLDLFLREKKIIIPGHYWLQAATSCQRPSSVIFMNITEADTDEPTLMKHHQLCSLFNYFGLAIHNLVSRQQYGRFFHDAEEDFIEIPGALLEQFCWETEVLECVGQHWAWVPVFNEIWARKQSTSTADKPCETLDRDTIQRLQAWKSNNEGLEKLKECQHAMFDMGFHRSQEPRNIHHSVIWSEQMSDHVSPFSMKAMEEIEDVWEWGQCLPKLDGLCMRYMGRQTKLLINECARDLFETRFKNNLADKILYRRFIETVLEASSNSTGLYKLWDFLGRCPKPFDQMVGYSSLQDRRTGEEHECLVYWRRRHEDEERSQSTAPNRRRSEDSKHSADLKGSRDPKHSEKSHHPEESNRSYSTTTSALTILGTHTHTAANMDVAIRHPVFLGSTKLVKAPKGVATCHRQWSSPIAEGYVYVNKWMNWKGVKGLPSLRPEKTRPATDKSTAVITDAQISYPVPFTNRLNTAPAGVSTGAKGYVGISIYEWMSDGRDGEPHHRPENASLVMAAAVPIENSEGVNTDGDEESSLVAKGNAILSEVVWPWPQPKPRPENRAIVVEKVPTIRVGFVVVKTASGERQMSVTDWMMWKDKDTKWLSDPRLENRAVVTEAAVGVGSAEESLPDDLILSEEMWPWPQPHPKQENKASDKEAPKSISSSEESLFDDGIAKEEMEGRSSSSSKTEKFPTYSEPSLVLGSMRFD